MVSYSHNSCFIIFISYHFWLPLSFQFDLIIDTLFVSAHHIFSYHTFTQGTFGFNILFLVQFFLLSFIVFFGILFYCLFVLFPVSPFAFQTYIALPAFISVIVSRLKDFTFRTLTSGKQVGDKCKLMQPKAPKSEETSVGHKCKIMRPKTPRVKDKCGRQVEDKCKLMRPKVPKCEGQVGDKCKIMRPKAPRVKDKCGRQVEETSVNSFGPRHPKWETSGRQVQTHAAQGNQSGRQVWKTRMGDKCKLMRSKTSRVGDTCGKQLGDKCKLMRPKAPRVGDKCEGQVGDKCKLMRPKAPRVGDKYGRQMEDK